MDKKSRELVMAKLYFKNKDYKMAEKSFNEYLSINPEDVSALKLLAQVYEQNKRFDKAFEMYERCYLAEPDRTGVLLDICRILLMNDIWLDNVDYRKWLNLAIKAFPSNPIVVNFKAFLSTLPQDEQPSPPKKTTVSDDLAGLILEKLSLLEKKLQVIEDKLNMDNSNSQVSASGFSFLPSTTTTTPAPAPLSTTTSQPAPLPSTNPAPAPLFTKAPAPTFLSTKSSVPAHTPTKAPTHSSTIAPAQFPSPSITPILFSSPTITPAQASPPDKAPVPAPMPTPSPTLAPEPASLTTKVPAPSSTSAQAPAPIPTITPAATSIFPSFSTLANTTSSQLPTFTPFNFSSGNPFEASLKKLNLPVEGAWAQPSQIAPWSQPFSLSKPKEESKDDDEDGVVPNEELAIENTCDMTPIEIKTGEEDEDLLFEQRAKLFRFKDREYKERGLGAIKVLKHKTTGKGRIIMRREATGLVCLNCWDITNIERVRPLQVKWAGIDASDGDPQATILLIKLKTPELTDTFQSHLETLFSDAASLDTSACSPFLKNSQKSDSTSDKSDVELVDPKLDQSLVDKARKYKLPDLFYHKIKNQECGGCNGCEKED